MRFTIPEILDQVEKAKTKEEKIKILRGNDSVVLRGMLQLNYNDQKWNIPEGEPPFKKDKGTPVGLSETNLFVEARRLYVFLDEKSNVHKMKREQLFIDMLEGIHFTEAEMLCLVKDKQLQKKYKSIKRALVEETFPGLLPAEVKEKKVPLEQK